MNTTHHHARIAPRLAAIAIGIALLASCGSNDATTADATTANGTAAESAGYTIEAGDTLSGIADRAGVSVADIVTANGWPDGSDHLILPGDVIKLPPGSSSVSPKSASPVTSPAKTEPASTAAPVGGGYEQLETPTFDSLFANQKSDPISDPLPDGQYWSWDYTSDGENVSFTLVQYFYGDACREQFGDGEDACSSDNNTLYSPSANVALADAAATSVGAWVGDGRFVSYRVSTSEFARLVAGHASAPDTPTGFTYERYAVIVTVRNGQAIAADQIFTS